MARDLNPGKFREALGQLSKRVRDVQAILVVGPKGVVDHILEDPALNIETIAGEYETLLRIAARASEDSGAGTLVENVVVSEKSIMVARTIFTDHCIILISRSRDQIGRTRYELKRAASELEIKSKSGW
jgi:predicted regulator of Ras-like GTPase activity (Roadblock/LC7/MglB family)